MANANNAYRTDGIKIVSIINKNMSLGNNNNRQGEGGSGSAENMGGTREDQKAQHTHLDSEQKADIAKQAQLKPEDIVTVEETGATSGRDDAGGGSGDNIENTSSNDGTDKF